MAEADVRTRNEARWRALMAPRTGNLMEDLLAEAADFFGLSAGDARDRAAAATQAFAEEWRTKQVDPSNPAQVVDFYNTSEAEVFDLIGWHAEDTIHHRTFHCVDLAVAEGAATLLDYGSGIGSDAIVAAEAGLTVTLADVSDRLLAFAKWRCERRGFTVAAVDLKRSSPPVSAFDAAICFDVLEHVPDPPATVGAIGRALKPHGLLFVHAPFGPDPLRPMHITHADVLTPRMRSLGFQLEQIEFPSYLWAPRVYRHTPVRSLDRLAYYVADVWLPKGLSERLGTAYRRMLPSLSRPRGEAAR